MEPWVIVVFIWILSLLAVILLSMWPWIMVAFIWAFGLFVAIPLSRKFAPDDISCPIHTITVCVIETLFVAIYSGVS